jgi:DNA replication protein DnaC
MLRPVPDPSDRGAERSDCPLGICEGNGWVLQEDGTAIPCDCRERRIGKALSRGMGTGIPKRFRGVSFDRKPICDLDPFVLRPVRTFVEGIAKNVDEGHGLWFTGDVGTGKTSLAMLVSQAAEKAGRSVAVYPVTRLLAEIKDTFDSDSTGSYMSLFRRLCSVDMLHLDDLGADRVGAGAALRDRQRALAGRALDNRHDQHHEPRRSARPDRRSDRLAPA